MQKFSSQPIDLFERIKSTTLKLYESPVIYPQMPVNQLQHFIAQAARNKKDVAIQYQAKQKSEIIEVEGKIELVPQSGQIIIRSSRTNLIHLVYPSALRHVRLV